MTSGVVSVSSLRVHPLKGCAVLPMPSLTFDERGPVPDRRWMVVDLDGTFLTQRELPVLALVRAELDDGVVLRAPGVPALRLPDEDGAGAVLVHTAVWGSPCELSDCGDEAAHWLTAVVGRPVRIGRLRDGFVRPIEEDFSTGVGQVGLADGFPVLLTSEASLDVVNEYLVTPVGMDRFRPNIVVTGSAAFEEDSWRTIRVGNLLLDVVKPCARCPVVDVDPVAGVRGRGVLEGLARFRKAGRGVMFGQNATHRGPGRVEVGDTVEIIERA